MFSAALRARATVRMMKAAQTLVITSTNAFGRFGTTLTPPASTRAGTTLARRLIRPWS
ncbi:hypothetical protein D3C77_766430 [compost metagenome]